MINTFIGKDIVLSYTNFKSFGWLLLVPVFTGLFAGTFPALFLSSFSPIVAMKNVFSPRKDSIHLRQVLVIFQFTVTIAFIIASFVIVKQVKYIQNKSLGLNKENILVFDQSKEIIKHVGIIVQILREKMSLPGFKHRLSSLKLKKSPVKVQ